MMAVGSGRSNRVAEVHRVTSAQEALSQQQRRRTRRYLITMSIRTVCFLALIFTHGWMQWAAIAGAVFLPYVAVVAANAGRENDRFTNTPVDRAPDPALPSHTSPVIEADPGTNRR